MNAAKHQLTSQAVFMPPSELADYLSIGAEMVKEIAPVGIIEHQFAQRIIDATWRLNRGIALETLAFNSRVAAASSAFIEAHPGESDATILANSQAQSFDKECVDIFDKLSRYGARIEKSLILNLEQLRVRRESRIGKRGHQYDEKTCAACAWYSELADLAYALVKAREEIQAKSVPPEVTPPEPPTTPATATEQSQLQKSLFCQKPIELVAPLTPETERTLRLAAQHGLLVGSEHTLFTQLPPRSPIFHPVFSSWGPYDFSPKRSALFSSARDCNLAYTGDSELDSPPRRWDGCAMERLVRLDCKFWL